MTCKKKKSRPRYDIYKWKFYFTIWFYLSFQLKPMTPFWYRARLVMYSNHFSSYFIFFYFYTWKIIDSQSMLDRHLAQKLPAELSNLIFKSFHTLREMKNKKSSSWICECGKRLKTPPPPLQLQPSKAYIPKLYEVRTSVCIFSLRDKKSGLVDLIHGNCIGSWKSFRTLSDGFSSIVKQTKKEKKKLPTTTKKRE